VKTESVSFVIFYLGVLFGICLVTAALFEIICDMGWNYTQIYIGTAMGISASGQFIYFLHRGKVNKNKGTI